MEKVPSKDTRITLYDSLGSTKTRVSSQTQYDSGLGMDYTFVAPNLNDEVFCANVECQVGFRSPRSPMLALAELNDDGVSFEKIANVIQKIVEAEPGSVVRVSLDIHSGSV